ncbi:MAG: hypothetical protein HKM93_10610 [Desulfobacteraceae bacterium]|nr:hypothetical protein [Desulfobacteraceae bacterium]
MKSQRIAILIAGSRFPKEPKLETLRYPENDVDGLHDVLSDIDRGGFDNILVFKNESHSTIIQSLNTALKNAGKNDLFLVYYSGHGMQNASGDLHLATADTVLEILESTSIPVATIKHFINTFTINKAILLLDCCYSGLVGKAFVKSSVEDQLQMMSRGRGVYVLTASTAFQVARETETDGHGIFTKYLIQGIRTGDADADESGHITMEDLYRYVDRHVFEECNQKPSKWAIDVQGELVIAKSGKTPGLERRKQLQTILADMLKESLPEAIFEKAWTILKQEGTEITDESKAYDQLLDRLLNQSIKPLTFVQEWNRIDTGDISPSEHRPIPEKKAPAPSLEIKRNAPGETATPTETNPAQGKSWKMMYGFLVIVLIVTTISITLAIIKQTRITNWSKSVVEIERRYEVLHNQLNRAEMLSVLGQYEVDKDNLIRQLRELIQQGEEMGIQASAARELERTIQESWNEQIRGLETEMTQLSNQQKPIIVWEEELEQIRRLFEQLRKDAAMSRRAEVLKSLSEDKNLLLHRVEELVENAKTLGIEAGEAEELKQDIEREWRELEMSVK